MIRIAICDDVFVTCAELENIILDFQKQTNEKLFVEVFYSGEDLIKFIKTDGNFDLIFLDIELSKINGIEVGQFIRNELDDYTTKIIYISSKNGYDRQLFDVQPLHFLPKPLDCENVIKDIKLAIKVLNKENSLFSYKVRGETHKIPIKGILYFESKARKIKIVESNKTTEFYGKIELIAEQVTNFKFIHPHKAYIVNYEYISKLKYDEIMMINGDRIPISQGKRKEIRSIHIKYMKGQ